MTSPKYIPTEMHIQMYESTCMRVFMQASLVKTPNWKTPNVYQY